MNIRFSTCVKRTLPMIGKGILWVLVLVSAVWAFGALWYLAYLPDAFRKILAAGYLAFVIFVFRRHFVGKRKGQQRRAKTMLAVTVFGIYLATLFVQPANDRVWAKDQERLPAVTFDKDQVSISNFRDFRYDSPERPIPRHDNLNFKLSELESVWFVVQRFTRFHGMAHTFVSFGLDTPNGKKYFSISVEIRREQDELYSPIMGIYRCYELMYVIGSEQDLVGVRTNARENDRVHLYRVNANSDQVQQLFLKFADRVNSLRDQPEFYNTFLSNCTNNIVANTWSLTPKPISRFSPRIILPGYSPRVAYKLGLIGSPDVPFETLQKESRIDPLARAAGISSEFSTDIRPNGQ